MFAKRSYHSKHEKIIQLEEKLYGLDIGISYGNCQYCGIFVDHMSKALAEGLNGELTRAKFFSVLWGGTTDISVLEQEVMFVFYFEPLPEDRDTVPVKRSFLGLRYVNHGHIGQ